MNQKPDWNEFHKWWDNIPEAGYSTQELMYKAWMEGRRYERERSGSNS